MSGFGTKGSVPAKRLITKDMEAAVSGSETCSKTRVIGQKVLIKTAVIIEKSMVVAVLSCSKQLTGWTESVDKTT